MTYTMRYILNGEYETLEFSAGSKSMANDHARHYCWVIGALLIEVTKA